MSDEQLVVYANSLAYACEALARQRPPPDPAIVALGVRLRRLCILALPSLEAVRTGLDTAIADALDAETDHIAARLGVAVTAHDGAWSLGQVCGVAPATRVAVLRGVSGQLRGAANNLSDHS